MNTFELQDFNKRIELNANLKSLIGKDNVI